MLDELSSPSRLGQRPGLETIRGILGDLGNPQDGLTIVHVGGTSGKGSTATIAARILQQAGYRVGLHVKPHLETVEERFVVNGSPIRAERLAQLIVEIAPIARKWRPSWYELTVALAFKHFQAERVDVAVVEVGLGGTYDATNVVKPSVVVLTNVGLDHVEVLGDTIEAIANDKVGIVKVDARTICGVTQPSVRAIVRDRCKAVGSQPWLLHEDFSYEICEIGEDGSEFHLDLPGRRLPALHLAPLGAHQIANAAVAVASCEALVERGFVVTSEAIRTALSQVAIPGRLEALRSEPLLVLDGAHNPAKMDALVSALDRVYPGREVIGILAFKRGHDLRSTVGAIARRLNSAILTTFDATTDYGPGQAVNPTDIDDAIGSLGIDLPRSVVHDPVRAVQIALGSAKPVDIVCVTGSLYLVGVVRKAFGHDR